MKIASALCINVICVGTYMYIYNITFIKTIPRHRTYQYSSDSGDISWC